jgi:DNA invertase Pin-like site-specific DNA recombinase
MMTELGNKVTAVHLKRAAYLYVRQSTPRQVVEHTESTKRQYALKQRAVQLGWRPEQVTVIDSDLDESGASTVDRDGFQKRRRHLSRGSRNYGHCMVSVPSTNRGGQSVSMPSGRFEVLGWLDGGR